MDQGDVLHRWETYNIYFGSDFCTDCSVCLYLMSCVECHDAIRGCGEVHPRGLGIIGFVDQRCVEMA